MPDELEYYESIRESEIAPLFRELQRPEGRSEEDHSVLLYFLVADIRSSISDSIATRRNHSVTNSQAVLEIENLVKALESLEKATEVSLPTSVALHEAEEDLTGIFYARSFIELGEWMYEFLPQLRATCKAAADRFRDEPPKKKVLDNYATILGLKLAHAYFFVTGSPPTIPSRDGHMYGPFPDLIRAGFVLAGIKRSPAHYAKEAWKQFRSAPPPWFSPGILHGQFPSEFRPFRGHKEEERLNFLYKLL